MTQTLNVEHEELLARAAELEQSLPTPPSATPQAPCPLSMTTGAAEQLVWNTDMVRDRLTRTQREYGRLAESLRNAAKAYEEVDEEAAQAVATDSSRSVSGFAGSDDRMMINCDPDEDYYPPPPPPPPPPLQYPYYPVRQAAKDIAAPDQGTAFLAFATEWDAFQRQLLQVSNRFRHFTHWEGVAAEAIEGHFSKQQRYLKSLADSCLEIINQARSVVSAHRQSAPDHPTAYDIAMLDGAWEYFSVGPGKTPVDRAAYYKEQTQVKYQLAQTKSEEVLAQYISRANLPLKAVMPDIPPPAKEVYIAPPKPPEQKPPDGEPGDGNPGDPGDGNPGDPTIPGDPGEADLPNPTDMGSPSAGGGMPAPPPTGDNAKLTDALKDLKKGAGLPTGAGMKPASLGGGGGMPAMPLQPSVDGGAASGAPAAAPGGAGLGRVPGLGAGGGMGGGMAPMGAPGQGQNEQGKGKRGPVDDDALYTEDRAWTEGVIGRRRAKDAPEK